MPVVAQGFTSTFAFATAGNNDTAVLYGSAGSNVFTSTVQLATMSGTGYSNSASGFAAAYALNAAGGNDTAYLFDSPGNNALVAATTQATLTAANRQVVVSQFSAVDAYDNLGTVDTVHQSAIDFALTTVGSWERV